MFKKKRGIYLPYNVQGLIHFMCVNYKKMPEQFQDGIRDLCREIAGADSEALFEVLTNDNMSVEAIARKHFLNEKRLYKWRKLFYEEADKKILSCRKKTDDR